ncbi:hypothetical protein Pmar_PMAR017721 [Perkinsus marinus ATCC 50983]|uniref:Uncharacterized protein n=1 Tax=Perkinsus marinus (strain ATCC 50983 / TXsc) TaxID=423536 RepID=C5L3T4_PERM5|nr:hypothetical protein Pmar_PMAR017721 [Perkinsus marinus ATCC 50983]EER08663.1 hypothetical protein Pmar_PMAR017721 [Perkinsus marinus ATCC 50983]|eukprot:XP_002776847.1 hypothetical protein Pmar_PMAR017721 [Perkinsus marinus ATCC 50983]
MLSTGPQSNLSIPSDVLPSSDNNDILAPYRALPMDLASIDKAFDRHQIALNELKRSVWKFLGYRRPRRLALAQRIETGLTILGGMTMNKDELVMLHRVSAEVGGEEEGSHCQIATIDCTKTPLQISPVYTKDDTDLEDISTDSKGRIYFLSKDHIYRLNGEHEPVEIVTNVADLVPAYSLDYIECYDGYIYVYEHVEQLLLRVPEEGGACEKVFDFDDAWKISAFDVRVRNGGAEMLSCSNDSNTCIQWRRAKEDSPRAIQVACATRCRFLDHPKGDLAVVGCCRPCSIQIIDLVENTQLCSVQLPDARSVCSVLANTSASEIYVTEWRVNHTYMTQFFIHYYDGDSEEVSPELVESPCQVDD